MKQFFKMMFASTLGVLIAAGIFSVCSIFFIMGILASAEGSSEYMPEKNTVFKLSLKGTLSDQAVKNPFDEIMGETNSRMSLVDITKAIRCAKTNDNIKGIYLEVDGLSGGFAGFEAIQRELKDFKESGKFIVAYGDFYTQGCYYLASVADSVYLNPLGAVSLTGLVYQGIFFTGLEEKLGIEPLIFKVGTYKSYTEPYVLKKFSEANREQITSFLGSVWGNMTSVIEKNRNIPAAKLEQFLNEGLALGSAGKAVDYKLVDALLYRNDVENIVKKMAGQDVKGKLKVAGVDKMASIKVKEKESKNKIAIYYAEGEITMEEPSSPWDADAKVITENMAKQIRKLKDKDDVKAVVLRVNSPGGNAFVAEQIWKAITELKAVKPVVVSMGDYAASGGYYISAPASKIIAERTTLTGSIGVFGILPNLTGTFEKIGLTTDVVKTNTYADLGEMSRPMREDEKALIQNSVERTYDLFISRCAEGRGMTKARIDSIGQGRVWTGEQAKGIGLVDELGGIEDAVKQAASLAEITDYTVTVADAPKDFITKFMEKKLDEAKVTVVKNLMGEDFETFRLVQKAKTQRGIMARMPFDKVGL
ncbi:signal peptide peptidase SppA [Parabacteroides chinchillae]